jgi:hypothetical protein
MLGFGIHTNMTGILALTALYLEFESHGLLKSILTESKTLLSPAGREQSERNTKSNHNILEPQRM